jgi:FtsH-binding integral membrane protein
VASQDSRLARLAGIFGAFLLGLVAVGLVISFVVAIQREGSYRFGTWIGWALTFWFIIVAAMSRPFIVRMSGKWPFFGWAIIFIFIAGCLTGFVLALINWPLGNAFALLISIALFVGLIIWFTSGKPNDDG